MNTLQWVVDTWVIENCNDFSGNTCLDCIGFLSAILEKGLLCLDTEQEIEKEYYRYIKPRTFLSRWWQEMVKEKGQIRYFSNKLSNKHEQELLINLKFDESDIKFVGVASKTKHNLLVSGDSDYTEAICNYLCHELSITVIPPQIAKTL
jgi:predicted nucleic acid-binding protein